jgi:integrase/recombinase XerD
VGPSGKKAPPGCYWWGGVLYAGIKIGGKRHCLSLKTDDPKVAAVRRKAVRAKLIEQEFHATYSPVSAALT